MLSPRAVQESMLTSGLFYKDAASKYESVELANGSDNINPGYQTRFNICKDSKLIVNNAENLVWNKCRYQSLVSYTCGHFCLHFLYNFVRNQSLSPLESDKIENNEKFIKKFVARKFRLQNCCFSPYSN
ncbi:uncharacterized protein TNCT_304272 [Trichonephila clavata]|uniref:Uncharacterized protein n=1 Tax=Trichonephila clavata TaxID=2740835 RepID=A0A8X6J4N4_TRICU|nr:uncharacterized protein TNCT_304272 [Trichonephila clavata]